MLISLPLTGPVPVVMTPGGGHKAKSHVEHYFLSETFESDISAAQYGSTTAPDYRPSHSGIQVVRFHVWQDLTAGTGDGVAPLHATVTFDMTPEWYEKLNNPCGTIKIEGLRGEGLVQAKLLINQAHYGLGLTQPGSRQIQFVMSPAPMYLRLDANQTVRGTVRVKFGDRQLILKLPETRVIFTR